MKKSELKEGDRIRLKSLNEILRTGYTRFWSSPLYKKFIRLYGREFVLHRYFKRDDQLWIQAKRLEKGQEGGDCVYLLAKDFELSMTNYVKNPIKEAR